MTRRAYGSGGGGSDGGGGGGGASNYYGAYADRPAAGNAGRLAYFTDAEIPQIDTGSTWRNIVPGNAQLNEALLTYFSGDTNLGTSVKTQVGGAITYATQQGGSTLVRSMDHTFGSTPSNVTITASLDAGAMRVSSNSYCWIAVRSSGTQNLICFGPTSTNAAQSVNVSLWAGHSSRSFNEDGAAQDYGQRLFRIRTDVTNAYFEISQNGGRSWSLHRDAVARASWLQGSITGVSLACGLFTGAVSSGYQPVCTFRGVTVVTS